MKKKLTMKSIFIPVAVVVIILMIVAVVLSKSPSSNTDAQNDSNVSYHVHEDGVTHYGEH